MPMMPATGAPAPMMGGVAQGHDPNEMGMQMGGAGHTPYQTHVDPALAYAANMRAQAAGWNMHGVQQAQQYQPRDGL